MSRWRSSVWKVRASAVENYARPTLARPWRQVGRPVASATNVEGSGSSWAVRLCGPLSVRAGGRDVSAQIPGRQGRLLLAYLVLNRERTCPRAELLDVLWPEAPPAAPDTALSALLSKLRKALGGDALRGRSELRLEPGAPVWVDVEAAAAGARRAEACAQDGDWAGRGRGGAGRARRRARATCCPTSTAPGCTSSAPSSRRSRSARSRSAAAAALRAAELGTAVEAARAAIALAPFRESAHRLLMEAHEAAGNPAEALRAFEDLRGLLREELGTNPGPDAMAVHERVLLGRPPARPRPAAAVPAGRRWPAPLEAIRARARVRRPLGRGRGARGDVARGGRRAPSPRRAAAAMPASARRGSRRSWRALAHDDGAVVLFGRFEEEASAPYQPVVQMLRGWAGGASLAPFAERLGPRAAELGLVLPELGAAGAGGGDAAARRPRPAPSGCACSTGSPRCWPRSPATRRCSSCSTTSTGPTCRRSSCSATSCARPRRRPRCSSPPRGATRASRRSRAARGPPARGDARADRARRPRRRRDRRARDGARRRAADAGLRRRAARGDRGQPVLHRGGRAPPAPGPGDVAPGATPAFRTAFARSSAAGSRGSASPRCAMLAVAAVIGREADYDVLDEAGPLHDDALVDALEEAVAAGVLREDPERVGRYAFSHALMRATLYDGLSGAAPRAPPQPRGGGADRAPRRPARPAPRPARPPLRAGRAGRPARARGRLRARRRAPRRPAARLGGGGRPLPRRAARPRARGRRRGPDALRAAARPGRVAGARGDAATPRRRSRRPPRRRGRSATPGCSAAPRSATPAAGRSSAASRRTSPRCSRRRSPGSATRRSRCARGCSPGSRSSSTTRAIRSAGSRSPTRRSSSPAGSATRRRSPPAWTRATTRCGGRRPSTSGSRWRPSCAGSPRRSATRSWSWRARAGPWSTCSSWATSRAPTSRSRPPRGSPRRSTGRSTVVDVAVPLRAGADRRALRRGRAARRGDARDRPPRPGRERHPRLRAVDVQHPPRAGAPRRGRGGRARDDRALSGGARLALLARAAAARARARRRPPRRSSRRSRRPASTRSRATRTG